jgi:flavin-binding protein dodecin
MPVYDVIELIGTSSESWEKAAANAVEQASKSLRDLRVAEIAELDMQFGREGKGRGISRKGQIVVQIRGLLNEGAIRKARARRQVSS